MIDSFTPRALAAVLLTTALCACVRPAPVPTLPPGVPPWKLGSGLILYVAGPDLTSTEPESTQPSPFATREAAAGIVATGP
jgi:hypothetical protein